MTGGTNAQRPAELIEAWRCVVPGTQRHVVATDVSHDCLVVGDGWGVAFAALRLHRLSLSTGVETATMRTRHQPVGALAIDDGYAWVATSKRLLQLRLDDLSVVAEWTKGLVANTQQLVVIRDRIVMANWLAASIGLFDPSTGATKRLRVGPQPVLIRGSSEAMVASGFDGGLFSIDVTAQRLVARRHTAPITTAVAIGDDVWCVPAGTLESGYGEPSVASKRGSSRVVRVQGGPVSTDLSGRAIALFADEEQQVLWCITGDSGEHLDKVDADTGQVVATFTSAAGPLCHVDPHAQMAFATAPDPSAKDSAVLVAFHVPSD